MSGELTRIQVQTGVFHKKIAREKEKVAKLDKQIAATRECVPVRTVTVNAHVVADSVTCVCWVPRVAVKFWGIAKTWAERQR